MCTTPHLIQNNIRQLTNKFSGWTNDLPMKLIIQETSCRFPLSVSKYASKNDNSQTLHVFFFETHIEFI